MLLFKTAITNYVSLPKYLMMKKFFTLILFITLSAAMFAQADAYSEDVKTCVKSNGTYDYYADVVDQMFTMLKQQYASKNVPDSIWKEFEDSKSESMDELSQMLVSAYRGYFSHEDVKKMNTLYQSKTGRTMIKNAQGLTEGDKVVLGEFYESDTGKKIIGSQEDMNKLMSKISEIWSSDMYRGVVTKLSEKGFSLEQ